MSIKNEIAKWDGKSSSDIKAIYGNYCNNQDFISTLIKCITEIALQNGATWLLKHHLENNSGQSDKEINKIFKLLPKLDHWEAKLHILQCLPYLTIHTKEKKGVETFLRKNLVDKNKFVRAWTYNGFYQLSLQHPEYHEETQQFLAMAMRDEAPSVKARIRNILKDSQN